MGVVDRKDVTAGRGTTARRADDHDLVDSLVAVLQERINAGQIPVGSWLRQEALAKDFGVSRMPVREALRQLQARGAVELIANRGARVRLPSTLDIIEVYELHAILQGHAGAAAAELITSEQLDRLAAADAMFRRAVEELRTADGDTSPAQQLWQEANTDFHHVVIEAGGNRHLSVVLETLHHKVPHNLTWLALGNDVRRLEKDAAEHAGILEAIGRGDAATTRARLTEHVRRASDLLVRRVDEIGRAGSARLR
ncbi:MULTISPECIES: GntR family transcriptional regulator [Pseudonocardia]|uniref:GntR family transcriptional regulator n=1 Tax=Pseudonocardia TaxID=1847 RepID=UPI000CD28F99|nr:GntR family transcriptional regulator [Pseudonocardia dioxanivorans]GJF02391.1 GntR family transcriptional regulator [Pseudonocardia sp. D17]